MHFRTLWEGAGESPILRFLPLVPKRCHSVFAFPPFGFDFAEWFCSFSKASDGLDEELGGIGGECDPLHRMLPAHHIEPLESNLGIPVDMDVDRFGEPHFGKLFQGDTQGKNLRRIAAAGNTVVDSDRPARAHLAGKPGVGVTAVSNAQPD